MASFDPTSPGARRLAETWPPHLERWQMRIPPGHSYFDDIHTKLAGETIEVSAPHGRELQTRGYELLTARTVTARG